MAGLALNVRAATAVKTVKKAAPAKKNPFFKAPAPAPPPAPKKKVVKKRGASKKDLSAYYGPNRKLYLPSGLLDPATDVPSYLNGTLAGDYGFDPLGLGQDGKVEAYREYELIHARWAMLGVAGAVFQNSVVGDNWSTTGLKVLQGETISYVAPPFAKFDVPLPLFALLGIQIPLMYFVEKYRTEGTGPDGWAPKVGKFTSASFAGLDSINPGGPLDFFGFASDPEDFKELKVKEIKNGRLAMVTMLGIAVQAAVTGEGPVDNWAKHVADPFGYNFVTITAPERTPTL